MGRKNGRGGGADALLASQAQCGMNEELDVGCLKRSWLSDRSRFRVMDQCAALWMRRVQYSYTLHRYRNTGISDIHWDINV